jgi:hypothetical protein
MNQRAPDDRTRLAIALLMRGLSPPTSFPSASIGPWCADPFCPMPTRRPSFFIRLKLKIFFEKIYCANDRHSLSSADMSKSQATSIRIPGLVSAISSLQLLRSEQAIPNAVFTAHKRDLFPESVDPVSCGFSFLPMCGASTNNLPFGLTL